jgi:hypothetical protein
VLAVDDLGEYSRRTGFSDSSWTAEQVRMSELVPHDGVLQRSCDIVLADKGLERIRAVFSG